MAAHLALGCDGFAEHLDGRALLANAGDDRLLSWFEIRVRLEVASDPRL